MIWPSSWPLAVPSATGKRCALSACTQSCLKLASLTLNRQGRGDEALCAAMPKIAQQDLNLESVVGRTIASHAPWHKPSCTSCISDVLFCKTPLFQTRLSLQRGSGVRSAPESDLLHLRTHVLKNVRVTCPNGRREDAPLSGTSF